MSSVSKKEFGKYINRRRKEIDLTREEMAQRLQVSVDAIAKWEQGNRYPDFEMVAKIAEVLNVSVQDIYDNSVEKTSAYKKVIITSIMMVMFCAAFAGGIYLIIRHGGYGRNGEGEGTVLPADTVEVTETEDTSTESVFTDETSEIALNETTSDQETANESSNTKATLPIDTEYEDPRIIPCMTFINWTKEDAGVQEGIYYKKYSAAFVPVIDIPVYAERTLNAEMRHINKDDVCYVNASDGKEWVYIQADSGTEGWMYIKEASLCSADEYAEWVNKDYFAPEYSVYTEKGLVPLYEAFIYDHDGEDIVWGNSEKGLIDVGEEKELTSCMEDGNIYTCYFENMSDMKNYLGNTANNTEIEQMLESMENYMSEIGDKYYKGYYQLFLFKTKGECKFARFMGDELNDRIVILTYENEDNKEHVYLYLARNRGEKMGGKDWFGSAFLADF